jgi:hypothetical protein
MLPWQLFQVYKFLFVHLMIYIGATLFTRLSLCAFYLRLIPYGIHSLSRWIKWFMALLILISMISVIVVIFDYTPISAAWDISQFLGTVRGPNIATRVIALSAIYCVLDILILVIPIWLVWDLHAPWQKKLRFITLFCFGGIACVVVITRTIITPWAFNSFDATWKAPPVGICNQLECTIGIISACIPILHGPARALYHGNWRKWSSNQSDESDREKPSPPNDSIQGTESDTVFTSQNKSFLARSKDPESGCDSDIESKHEHRWRWLGGMRNVVNFTTQDATEKSKTDFGDIKPTNTRNSQASLDLPIQRN